MRSRRPPERPAAPEAQRGRTPASLLNSAAHSERKGLERRKRAPRDDSSLPSQPQHALPQFDVAAGFEVGKAAGKNAIEASSTFGVPALEAPFVRTDEAIQAAKVFVVI